MPGVKKAHNSQPLRVSILVRLTIVEAQLMALRVSSFFSWFCLPPTLRIRLQNIHRTFHPHNRRSMTTVARGVGVQIMEASIN
jgi:hypothetical protein